MKRMFAATTRPDPDEATDDAPGAAPVVRQSYDDKLAKLQYLNQMLVELRRLAGGIEEPTLVYLIEMAAVHARDLETDHRFRNAIVN